MNGPLEGLRVLDFCWVGAGALVTKFLAEHGADVIKIESRSRPDNLRLAPPYHGGIENIEGSGYFASRNPSKRSFALNMKDARAQEIARTLAAQCSVVTNNFRPGVMERWGLGYQELSAERPDLIYLSMPMQGADGPHRDFVGFGSTIAALSGLVELSGKPDRTPIGTGTHYPDHIPNPGHALVALLASLYRRKQTGIGGWVELSQFESTVNVLGPSVVAHALDGSGGERVGNRIHDAAPHGVFPCAGEDRWCAIAVHTEAQWHATCQTLALPELFEDSRFSDLSARKAHEDELEALIATATRAWSDDALERELQACHVPAAAVRTSRDVLEDPHLRARGFWRRLDHDVMGTTTVPGLPLRSLTQPSGSTRAAPLLGEHTWEIAEELLGMTREEFDELTSEGVLA